MSLWSLPEVVLENEATTPLSTSRALVASAIPEEMTDWAFSAVKNPMFRITKANAAAEITKATRIIAVSKPVIPRRFFNPFNVINYVTVAIAF